MALINVYEIETTGSSNSFDLLVDFSNSGSLGVGKMNVLNIIFDCHIVFYGA